jgi:hypothetical protein
MLQKKKKKPAPTPTTPETDPLAFEEGELAIFAPTEMSEAEHDASLASLQQQIEAELQASRDEANAKPLPTEAPIRSRAQKKYFQELEEKTRELLGEDEDDYIEPDRSRWSKTQNRKVITGKSSEESNARKGNPYGARRKSRISGKSVAEMWVELFEYNEVPCLPKMKRTDEELAALMNHNFPQGKSMGYGPYTTVDVRKNRVLFNVGLLYPQGVDGVSAMGPKRTLPVPPKFRAREYIRTADGRLYSIGYYGRTRPYTAEDRHVEPNREAK